MYCIMTLPIQAHLFFFHIFFKCGCTIFFNQGFQKSKLFLINFQLRQISYSYLPQNFFFPTEIEDWDGEDRDEELL